MAIKEYAHAFKIFYANTFVGKLYKIFATSNFVKNMIEQLKFIIFKFLNN